MKLQAAKSLPGRRLGIIASPPFFPARWPLVYCRVGDSVQPASIHGHGVQVDVYTSLPPSGLEYDRRVERYTCGSPSHKTPAVVRSRGPPCGGCSRTAPPLPYSRNTDMGASMFFVSSSLLGLDPVAANPPCGVRGRFGGPVPIQYHVRAVFSQAGDEVIAARGRRLGVSHSGSYPRNLGGTRTRPAGALGALISEDVTGAAEVPSAPFCQRRRGRRARGLGACPQRRWCPVSLLGASCPLAKWPSACVLVQRAAAAAMPRAD